MKQKTVGFNEIYTETEYTKRIAPIIAGQTICNYEGSLLDQSIFPAWVQ